MKYLKEILETSVIKNPSQIGPCVVEFYSENEKHHDEQVRFELLPFSEFQSTCAEIAKMNKLKPPTFAQLKAVWVKWSVDVMSRCQLKWWAEGRIK